MKRLATLVATGLVLVVQSASAQQVEVRVARGPHYVGVPIDVEVHSEGFERSPEPECSAPDPVGGRMTLHGISPNISSSLQIVNGQVFRSESVRFTCHFRFVADQAGRLPIGPFAMRQGGDEVKTQLVKIEVREVPLDGRMRLRIRVPDEPVYLGQRVPIEIEWWLRDGLEERIHGYVIRSPLFDMEDRIRFVDDELAGRNEQALNLDTAQGDLRVRATSERVREGEHEYLVLRARRTLVPLRAGKIELGAGHVQAEEITRYSRDLFGRRNAAETRRLLARDLARTLETLPPPAEDRPPSFAGAVGRGFVFDVTADRSVVQVGDPIRLTLTIEGDGNLETIGLPPLQGEGGLDPQRFRLPDGDLSGRLDGTRKTFELSVRVLDEAVEEIPALAYSWFDPEARRYETTRSRPIALSVKPAQVVAADDVVRSEAALREDAMSEVDTPAPSGEEVRDRRALALESADLSIERDPRRLVAAAPSPIPLTTVLYASSLALLGAAFVVQKRSARDPREAARAAAVRDARARIDATGGLSGEAALSELASALRALLAATEASPSEPCERLLRECDDALYAPGGSERGVDADMRARAHAVVDALEQGQ